CRRIVPKATLCWVARAAGIFPLGFGWQLILSSLLTAQPGTKLLGVAEGHNHHWVVAGLRKTYLSPVIPLLPGQPLAVEITMSGFAIRFGICLVASRIHKLLKLAHGYVVLSQIERLGNPHAMSRTFTSDIPNRCLG